MVVSNFRIQIRNKTGDRAHNFRAVTKHGSRLKSGYMTSYLSGHNLGTRACG